MRTRLALLLLALALPLAACGDDPIGPVDPEDVTFAAELGIDLDEMMRLPSGVYIRTLVPGPGSLTVDAADEVEMAYTLWLPDGTEIQEGQFTLALSQLIPGFRDGVIGMVEGEVRQIVVPSDQGYGADPPGGSNIPVHSVLVFQVELLDITTEGA